MEFKQIKGNTWAFMGTTMMPVYRLNERDCVLLDTGYPNERRKILESLEQQELNLCGIICSHGHIDHIGSAEFLRKKFDIPLYLSQSEGAMMLNVLNAKVYRVAVTPKETFDSMADCLSQEAILLPESCGKVEIGGAEFLLEHTPGHSTGHLCIVTPDDVCYLGDAVLSHDQMDAKFPYALDVGMAIKSHQKIGKFGYSHYIMAHYGDIPFSELPALVAENRELFEKRCHKILDCLYRPKTIDRLTMDLCQIYELKTTNPKRIYFYQRTLRFYLDYLEDMEEIKMIMTHDGILYEKKASPIYEA